MTVGSPGQGGEPSKIALEHSSEPSSHHDAHSERALFRPALLTDGSASFQTCLLDLHQSRGAPAPRHPVAPPSSLGGTPIGAHGAGDASDTAKRPRSLRWQTEHAVGIASSIYIYIPIIYIIVDMQYYAVCFFYSVCMRLPSKAWRH